MRAGSGPCSMHTRPSRAPPRSGSQLSPLQALLVGHRLRQRRLQLPQQAALLQHEREGQQPDVGCQRVCSAASGWGLSTRSTHTSTQPKLAFKLVRPLMEASTSSSRARAELGGRAALAGRDGAPPCPSCAADAVGSATELGAGAVPSLAGEPAAPPAAGGARSSEAGEPAGWQAAAPPWLPVRELGCCGD